MRGHCPLQPPGSLSRTEYMKKWVTFSKPSPIFTLMKPHFWIGNGPQDCPEVSNVGNMWKLAIPVLLQFSEILAHLAKVKMPLYNHELSLVFSLFSSVNCCPGHSCEDTKVIMNEYYSKYFFSTKAFVLSIGQL